MWNNISKFLFLFLGAALGFVSNVAIRNYDGAIRKVEIAVASRDVISSQEINGKKIRLILDDKDVARISSESIYLFNRTDKNFDSLKFSVLFQGIEDGASLISQKVDAKKGQLVEIGKEFDERGQIKSITYTVSPVNRSEIPFFDAVYYFSGGKSTRADGNLTDLRIGGVTRPSLQGVNILSGFFSPVSIPSVSVMMLQAGVEVEEYSPYRESLWSRASGWIIILLFLGAIVVGYAGVVIYLFRRRWRSIIRRHNEVLTSIVTDRVKAGAIADTPEALEKERRIISENQLDIIAAYSKKIPRWFVGDPRLKIRVDDQGMFARADD